MPAGAEGSTGTADRHCAGNLCEWFPEGVQPPDECAAGQPDSLFRHQRPWEAVKEAGYAHRAGPGLEPGDGKQVFKQINTVLHR